MRVIERVDATLGGPGRFKTMGLLSAALASAAGTQTIAGAVAPEMKVTFGIDNVGIGLLVTSASLVGAATTLPFGVLADRVPRVRMLAACVVWWSLALVVAGSAANYSTILLAHIALGAGIGAATPVVASLAGDLFPAHERGRIFGFVLAGEFAGAAIGLLAAGQIAAVVTWRWSFWILSVPGLLLAGMLVGLLAEPVRGAMVGSVGERREDTDAMTKLTLQRGISPHASRVLHDDPTHKPLWWALRYVLSIPSNVLMIVASALLYYFVAGLQTFAVVFLRGRFDLDQGIATILLVVVGAGVITGTLFGGPISDRLLGSGRLAARPVVAGIACLMAVLFFVPGFAASALLVSMPLFFFGAMGLGAANPPLDAARLDIVHSRLWGRAESVRSFLQNLSKSSAPLVFGWLSTVLSPVGTDPDQVQGGGAIGLTRAFVVMLLVLLAAGLVLLLVVRRCYPRDVATALVSEINAPGR